VRILNLGHLTSRYHNVHGLSDLAEEFSRWTKSFPRYIPSDLMDDGTVWDRKYVRKQNLRIVERQSYVQSIISYVTNSTSFSNFTLRSLGLKHSQEPIIGSFRSLEGFDRDGTLFLLSGMYVLSRVVYTSYKYIFNR
jgi:hypothetical protein